MRCFCERKSSSQKVRTKPKHQLKCISNHTSPRKKTFAKKSSIVSFHLKRKRTRKTARLDKLNICPRVLRTKVITMVHLHVEARSKAASGFLGRRGHQDAVSLNLFVDFHVSDSKRFGPFRLQASFKRW